MMTWAEQLKGQTMLHLGLHKSNDESGNRSDVPIVLFTTVHILKCICITVVTVVISFFILLNINIFA